MDVYLPALAAPVTEVAEPAQAPDPAETGALVGRLILVADDKTGVRRFITRALEKRGVRVVEAVDGLDAVERFGELAPRLDIAVLDVTMPGRIGTEVLQEIRRGRPHLPVILASGYDAADSVASVAEMEGVIFLQKPFAITDLVERILALLD